MEALFEVKGGAIRGVWRRYSKRLLAGRGEVYLYPFFTRWRFTMTRRLLMLLTRRVSMTNLGQQVARALEQSPLA